MIHLAMTLLTFDASGDAQAPVALFAFLSIGAIALFGIFLPTVHWLDTRRKEREAYYRSEMLRRIAEAPAEGAKSALEWLREEERLKAGRQVESQMKRLEGMKIGGLVNIAVGIGLGVMLWVLAGPHGPYLVGSIPFLIGVALLIYVFFMAEPSAP